MKRKKKITKEKLLEIMGQKIYLMTINGKILKTKDYAFIMADTKENADEYLQQLNDQIYIDGISESQSAMDTLRNAYKKGKEVFPDSEKLYIGKAIVGSKDGYGIYLDGHSRYGVKLYNKDTKDEIGFFYTLPEIIASIDLIKE